MGYHARTIDLELDEFLPLAPAIAIDGAKGVGKTATAVRRANLAWYLDDPAQREVARADFDLSSVPPGTLLLDEWQQLPQVGDSVRRQVDGGAPPGRFLLTRRRDHRVVVTTGRQAYRRPDGVADVPLALLGP